MNERLAAALGYADRGVRVLPLHSIRADRCTCAQIGCPSPSKHPLGTLAPNGVKNATTDAATITAWWTREPFANVGIATGAVSGIVVLDNDPRHGGNASLEQLQREHGPLPATVESITGGGGRHTLFTHPGGRVANRVGIAPGLDVRGDGGYIVAPPSLHQSGQRYTWRSGAAPGVVPLAPMPSWLLVLVCAPTSPRRGTEELGGRIPKGTRNETMASFAGSMRHRGMTAAAIEAALLIENETRCDPPLAPADVKKIAIRIARYEPAGSPNDRAIDNFEVAMLAALRPRI